MAGLLIRYMLKNGLKPVLAVDADANANLNEVLGVTYTNTIGDAREEMKKGGLARHDQRHLHGNADSGVFGGGRRV